MDDDTKFCETGRRVIMAESQALEKLADQLDGGFAEAIDRLLATDGRVIVSGMGKSGHIARKIAATFASTGTPSHFVHPAEASHGDLGMVTAGDIVIAISNSGEAPELANLIAYTRRFEIPLIAITSQPQSSLATQSDVLVTIPQTAEACGTGVVPTNSTTMTLALGDALAVTLMEHRAFTPENFRAFHPGGKLGARLSKVNDIMHRGDDVPLVRKSTPMSEVLLTISQKGFGVAGVIDGEDQLIGVITDGDLRRHMENLMALTAEEVMTSNPTTISPDALAEEAVALMAGRITCVFVVDPANSRSTAGILHLHDCLRAGVV